MLLILSLGEHFPLVDARPQVRRRDCVDRVPGWRERGGETTFRANRVTEMSMKK